MKWFLQLFAAVYLNYNLSCFGFLKPTIMSSFTQTKGEDAVSNTFLPVREKLKSSPGRKDVGTCCTPPVRNLFFPSAEGDKES